MENPKLHLKHLLGERVYTARVSEEIATRLEADTITGSSPSFRAFADAMTNGGFARDADAVALGWNAKWT